MEGPEKLYLAGGCLVATAPAEVSLVGKDRGRQKEKKKEKGIDERRGQDLEF